MRNQLLPLLTVARITFKEIIRERLLAGIFIIALLVTAASFFLATISLDQNHRVILDTGIAAIHLSALFITVFVATNSMSKDLDRRALYLLLPKPMTRTQYVLGKYVGFLQLLLTSLLLLGGLFLIGLLLTDRSILFPAFIDLLYSFLEISLLLAFATLFATFTAPLNAALYTVALFIIGHSLSTLQLFIAKTGTAFVKGLINALYYLLPNLDKFDVRRAILYGLYPSHQSVVFSLLYWLLFTGLALFLAVRVMQVREV